MFKTFVSLLSEDASCNTTGWLLSKL